jgi:hypothetical protein
VPGLSKGGHLYSFSEFLRLLKVSPPLRSAGALSACLVTMLACIALFVSQREVYVAPDMSKLTALEGRVSGYPSSWEVDRSLMHFSVAYTLDGKREGKRIYTPHKLYKASGLRINSKVVLVAERVNGGSVVRELATLDGRVLFNDRLYRQVVDMNNASIEAAVVMGSVVALLPAIGVIVMLVRHRRQRVSQSTFET